MNWEPVLANQPPLDAPLRQRIDDLFARQRGGWPALRAGEAVLARLERKTLTVDGQAVIVQVNPGRRRSTLAATDAAAIASRPCFLCPTNMPAEERGVAFEDLVVLPNPFPILPRHCTIAAREHVPQRIAGRLGSMLRLARELGPDMVALYNGPRCGASAPDHFHLQAAAADDISLLREAPATTDRAAATPHESFGRRLFAIGSVDARAVERELERVIAALRVVDAADEPMVNLLAHWCGDRFQTLLFPRAVHRPACYFAEGDRQLAISPAVLEMAGILVTPVADHFARVDADGARTLYDEVSLSRQAFHEVLTMLRNGPVGQ